MGTKHRPIFRPKIGVKRVWRGHIKSGLTYLSPRKTNFKHKPRNADEFLDFEIFILDQCSQLFK